MATAAIPLRQLPSNVNAQQAVIPRHPHAAYVDIRQKFDLQIAELIAQAHRPTEAFLSDQDRIEMAKRMKVLKDFLCACVAANPTWPSGKKRFSHPDFPGLHKITKLFEILRDAVRATKQSRGLDICHIGHGMKIIFHFIELDKKAKGSERISADGEYSNELGRISREHWARIWRDQASIGIGQVYGYRRDMVIRAADAGLLMGEEAFSSSYLENERQQQIKDREGLAVTHEAYIRALAGTALAYQQANAAFRAPAPTPMLVSIPGHDGLAMRAPNGVYYN